MEKDFEGVLTILDESQIINENEELFITMIEFIIHKLINEKEFNKAFDKINNYKMKYNQYSKINEKFKELEFLIYFNLAKQEIEERNFDQSLKDFEKALNFKHDSKSCLLYILKIQIEHKKLYDEAIKKINEVEKNYNFDERYILLNLKAKALIGKAMNIFENDIEKFLLLIDQAMEIKEEEEDEIIKIKQIKLKYLIKYIESQNDKNDFINLEKYLNIVLGLKNEIKEEMQDIEEVEKKLECFQIEFEKKKILNLMEKHNYKECIKLCDEFVKKHPNQEYYIREIKQIKIDCLLTISDNLIQQDQKDEFIKIIKEISILQNEIESELGINENNTDLIDIMIKVIEKKAEDFNRNNLYNISEKISDLGLELSPNNLNLLTEKSISNSMRGFSRKAIDINEKILAIQPDNLSTKLNTIIDILKLNIKDLNETHINDLFENIKKTNIIDGDSKVLVARSIEALTELIKKYGIKICGLFKNIIFPKKILIDFSFEMKELQYVSSELLKAFYNFLDEKALITDNYSSSCFWKGEIKEDDKHILETIEKIILSENIQLEIKVNILFLYSKMDSYFIMKLNCVKIPFNFIEFLFKFRDDYSEFIDISLKVISSLIEVNNVILSESIKRYLIEYIEKNIKYNNLMIDRADIEEYLTKNKYDKSKLEFNMESLKENFRKKLNEELINKVFTEEEIDINLLKHLQKYGINLEEIINKNKIKIKKNIETIFFIFFNYIKSNVNKIITEDLNYINNLFEINNDLYIKDNIINFIYEISKKNYKNELPKKLLINISSEIVKISNPSFFDNNIDNSTLFSSKESILMTNEERINILIDILYNFNFSKNKSFLDDSIFNNLCFYINKQKEGKINQKIWKILNDNKKRLKGDTRDIFEIVDNTNKLEKSTSDNDKIECVVNIEEKVKDGFELNPDTTKSLNNLIKKNKGNNKIMKQTIALVNTNIINNKKIDINLSEQLVNMFLDENTVLNKDTFDNLIICLINIIKYCKLDEQLSTILYNNLSNFSEKKVLNKLELAVVSLKIFTQKHYSFNKKPILNCLCFIANENIVKSNPFFKEIEDIILKSFNEQNLEKEIFNVLFELLNKNLDLLDCISLCLANSLKNKKQEEIDILVNWNYKKFESIILSNHINKNIVDILCKASPNSFKNSEIIKEFVFFARTLNRLNGDNTTKDIDILNKYISESKVKICEYLIKKIEEHLDADGSFCLLMKMIETNEIILLKKINLHKITKNLYFDFKTGIHLLNKIIKLKINFDDESLGYLSDHLYDNHQKYVDLNTYIHIEKLLSDISNIQSLPETVKNKLEIENFSFQGKVTKEKICLLRNILLENKMPERYYPKIKNIINNNYIESDFKIEVITDIFLFSLEKGDNLTNELWEMLFSILNDLKELYKLKYILVNKSSNKYMKKLFCKKFQLLFFNNKQKMNKDELLSYFIGYFMYVCRPIDFSNVELCNYENKIDYLFKLIVVIEFKNIPYDDLKNDIINLLNNKTIKENELIQIIFWIVKNNLTKSQKTLLFNILKNSSLKKYLNEINVENNFEKKIRYNLYNDLLNKQIRALCEKCEENFEYMKSAIIQFSPIEIEEDIGGIILKYIQFLNNIIKDNNSNLIIKRIFSYIEYFSVIDLDDNTEIISDKKYLDNLKEKWIMSTIKKEKNYSDDISKILIERFVKNDFENNIIKNFIKVIDIDSENNLKKFFEFYEKKNINKDLLTNLLFNDLKKNISLDELTDEFILDLINKYEQTDDTTKKMAKTIYKSNRWDIEYIYKFLNFCKNYFDKFNQTQINIIEETFKKTQFSFNKKNNKGETLFDILQNYSFNDLEYKIKQLGLSNSIENERTLEEIFSEILKNNSSVNDDLLRTIDEMISIFYEIEFELHRDRGEGQKEIEKWDENDINIWVNSERTKKNINEFSFIPELLSVISQANRLADGYLPRKVQIVSILLFLFTPKNKGLFTQIKTGEGKTTIVAILATINALRGKKVDVLTSSEVLAETNAKEKQKFYSLFNLNVTHARKNKFHKFDIVYGDTLSFEGDFLRVLFERMPDESKVELERGQQCIIIDEVDNMCIDNLSASTRLVSEFGGYGALNGIYPLIYQNLNIIDQYILQGKFPDITEENRKEKTIEKLGEATRKIIEEGIENKIFVFPEHIGEFAKNQIKNWCESAYLAKNFYKQNIHYVISGKDGTRKISPVDYKNTGVVNINMQWSNGLHQFLQLKHGVRLENETLNTTFLSHYIFIRKYMSPTDNNIYGLTGTLGGESSQQLLRKLFNVNIIIVPTFKKSNFINLSPKILSTEEEWKKTIIDNILNPINNKRVILIICNTIEKVQMLSEELKSKNYPDYLIEKYQRNDSDFRLKEKYGPGYIIFATNLAGRGTDIKLTDEVEKNGGMHVILSFLPVNQRVEEQALGRTARNGKNGSGIIITQYDLSKISLINEKMEEVKIDKNFQILSLLREIDEKEKLSNVEKNEINSLKLKAELFDKFTELLMNLKKNFKKKGYDKSKINGIAKDVEEKWGLWMKKYGLDEEIHYSKKKEIIKAYKEFEKKIKKEYFKSKLQLLNPFNYFTFDDYSSAYEQDKSSCFFAKYYQEIGSLGEKKNDEEKETLKNKVNETCDELQDNLQTSLEAMYSTISNLHNILSEENKDFKPYEDCQIDIKNKLIIIKNISEGLKKNVEIIEQSKGNDNQILKRKNFVNISDLTKNKDIQIYFISSMKIYGFWEISIEVKKDWFAIIFTVCLGALEIIGGCVLLCLTDGAFGSEFIEEGYNDIKYGVECMLGKKAFSWSEFKKKKINFLIKTAVKIVIKLLTCGIPIKPLKAGKLGAVFKQVGKKLLVKAARDVGTAIINHFIGPDVIQKIISKIEGVLRNGVINFFGNKLKQLIHDEFGSVMCVNIMVYKGKNPIERLLKEQLKLGLRNLGNLIKLLVRILKKIFSAIKNKDVGGVLKSIFEESKHEILELLNSGLKKSLSSLVSGSLSELKNLIIGKIGKDKTNAISSWSEYLLEGAKVCSTIAEAESLTSLLVDKGYLSLEGELKNNKKIKLNLGIDTKLIRNIGKKINFDPIEKFDNIIYDIKGEIKSSIEREFSFIIRISDDIFNTGIIFLIEEKDNMKNTILKGVNNFKDEIIQKLICSINNMRNSIIKSSEDDKISFNEKYNNLKEVLNLEDILNKKITGLISDNFCQFDNIIKAINEKVNINGLLEKIKEVTETLTKIFTKILFKYIPLIEIINKFIEQNEISEIIGKVKKIIETIQNVINKMISPIIEYVSNINNVLNVKGCATFIIDKVNISINSLEIMKNYKKCYNSLNKSLHIIKNDYNQKNEIIKDGIITKLDEILDIIYDLDCLINEKEDEILEKLFQPCDILINKLQKMQDIIKKKVENMISAIIGELNNACDEVIQSSHNLIQNSPKKFKNLSFGNINKALVKGDELFLKIKENINPQKLNQAIKHIQSLNERMEEYERSSQMDETINILNDILIKELFEILLSALKDSKIGELIEKASKALLNQINSMKKNLREELNELDIIPKNEINALVKHNINISEGITKKDCYKLKFERIRKVFIKIQIIIEEKISNYFRKDLKYSEEDKCIIYINSKLPENPFQKLLDNQLAICLSTFRDLIPIVGKLIKNVISVLKNEYFDSGLNLLNEFKDNSFIKIGESLDKSLMNLKSGLLIVISGSNLSKKNNNDLILTWSDYFIKGLKICKNVSEAEKLSTLLIENGVISTDGELNKKIFLPIGDLKHIKIKNFKLKLKLDLKTKYKQLKSHTKKKVNNIIHFSLKERIDVIIFEIEKEITKKADLVTQNCAKVVTDVIEYILKIKNDYIKTIKKEINSYVEVFIKKLIHELFLGKNMIEESSDIALDKINEIYNSIGNKINTIENEINQKIKEITETVFNKMRGNSQIKNLNEKINSLIKIIIMKISNLSQTISDSILNIKTKFGNEISQAKVRTKEILMPINEKINEKINNYSNSFIYQFNNDIKPVKDEIEKIGYKLNGININDFSNEKIYLPYEILSIINDIKKKYKDINSIIKNIDNKRLEIFNNFEYLILLLEKLYEVIDENVDNILNKIFKPFDNIIKNLKDKSNQIQNKINKVILPIISSIIKDYVEKIKKFCFNMISKLDNHGDELIEKTENKINNELVKYKKKAVNVVDKGFNDVKNALQKINFKEAETLLNSFKDICIGIKDYNEGYNLSEICDDIKNELKKIMCECIKESELCELCEMDYTSLIKGLNLD